MLKKAVIVALTVSVALIVWIWPLGGRRLLRHWMYERERASVTGRFLDPEGLAIDAEGNVWVADEDRSELFILDSLGGTMLRASRLEGVDRITSGDSIALLGEGRAVTISDQYLVLVRLEGRELTLIRTFGKRGSGDGEFGDPEGIAFDHQKRELYLADENNSRVVIYDSEGRFERAFPVDERPEGIALHGDQVYLMMSKAGWVSRYTKDGRFLSKFGGGVVQEPDFAVVSPDGTSLFITDNRGCKIEVFDLEGRHLRTLGGPGTAPGRFRKPGNLAFDRDGHIWVADGGNRRIQVLTQEGRPLRVVE
jgi:tripartite motif-containing protein 71